MSGDLFRLLSRKIKAIRPQSLIKAFVTILIILLPFFLAVNNYTNTNDDDLTVYSEKLNVTVYDLHGTKLTSEEGYPEYMGANSLVNIFKSLSTHKTLSQPLPSSGETIPIIAVLETDSSIEKLTCYFSFDKSSSFCINEAGEYFHIAPDDSTRFLSSGYSEYVYIEAAPPLLTTGDGDIIVPSEASWKYKNISGHLASATAVKVTDQSLLYNITGSLALSFSAPPDQCTISVSSQGKTLYEGDFNRLADLGVASNTKLSISISAAYAETPDSLYCGELNYSFDVKLHNSPTFSVSSFVASPGDFITLTCKNVSDSSELSLTPANQSSTIVQPIFIFNGDVATAIIPFSRYYEHSSFDFTVKCGTSQKFFSIKINQSSNSSKVYTIHSDGKDYASLLNESSSEEMKQLLSTLGNLHTPHIYLRSNFIDLTEYSFDKGYSYGDSVVISSNKDLIYYSNGIEYLLSKASNGVSVPVLNNGKIIHTGESKQLGLFAVVDHGVGIKTWYCHLSDIDVSEGDLVSKGESVGKAGNSGISSGDGFLLMFSVNDSFLDPKLIIGRSLY